MSRSGIAGGRSGAGQEFSFSRFAVLFAAYATQFATQTTWYVDPSAGSDANDGKTSGTALATIAECQRRLKLAGLVDAEITVNVLSAPTEDVDWCAVPTVGGQQNPLGGGRVSYVASNATLATGSISSFQAWASPSTDGQVADSSQSSSSFWTTYLDKLVVLTSGTNSGAWFVPVKDLGTKTARIGPVWNPSTYGNVTPTVGDAYKIVDFMTLTGKVGAYGPGNARVNGFAWSTTISNRARSAGVFNSGSLLVEGCKVDVLAHSVPINGGGQEFVGTLFKGGNQAQFVGPGRTNLNGCTFDGTTLLVRGNAVLGSSCCFHGGASIRVNSAGYLEWAAAQWFSDIGATVPVIWQSGPTRGLVSSSMGFAVGTQSFTFFGSVEAGSVVESTGSSNYPATAGSSGYLSIGGDALTGSTQATTYVAPNGAAWMVNLAQGYAVQQTQALSGAGNAAVWGAQQGAAGSAGGDAQLAAGEGGTPGTNNPGNVWLNLRTKVGSQTGGKIRCATGSTAAPTAFLDFYVDSAGQVNLDAGSNTMKLSTGNQFKVASTSTISIAFNGTNRIVFDSTGIGVFAHATAAQQNITGALSSVTDANAKAVLTSMLNAQVAYGWWTNGTT